jgi:tetratricopeptide (TPR) repeat protein
LGECYIRLGKPREAIASLTSSVSFGNKPFRALYLLAQALEASGRLNEAVLRLEQAVAMKPDFKAAHDLLGVLLRASAK